MVNSQIESLSLIQDQQDLLAAMKMFFSINVLTTAAPIVEKSSDMATSVGKMYTANDLYRAEQLYKTVIS